MAITRGWFYLPSKIGSFSNTSYILTGKMEVLAFQFSSISWDCGVFLCYFLVRGPVGSLILCGSTVSQEDQGVSELRLAYRPRMADSRSE